MSITIHGVKTSGEKFSKEIEITATQINLNNLSLKSVDLTPLGECKDLKIIPFFAKTIYKITQVLSINFEYLIWVRVCLVIFRRELK